MSSLKVVDIETNLPKKGFVRKVKRKDHIFFYYCPAGKKTTIWTKISHGESSIEGTLIDMMAKQTNLSKPEFIALVTCTLGPEEYLQKMIDRKKIPAT